MNSAKTVVFVDGLNLYGTAKSLGFDIDFKKLLAELGSLGNVVRVKYYTCLDEEDDDSPVVPLLDWLAYNGYCVVKKSVRSFTDAEGRYRVKGNIDVELAVDAMEIALYIDHVVLISGNGDLSALASAIQRQGKRLTVISSIVSNPPACADSLRRLADEFIDLAKLKSKIGRESSHRSDRNPVSVGGYR